MTKILISLFIFLVLTLAGFVGYEISTLNDTPKKEVINKLKVDKCDLQKVPCQFNHPEFGKITYDISPRPIRLNQELKLKVSFEQRPMQQFDAWIDFSSDDMNMGYNRPVLKQDKDDLNSYEANVVLPTCTADKMTWRSTVLIKINKRFDGAQFEFLTEKK